jgi:hypothetical protein
MLVRAGVCSKLSLRSWATGLSGVAKGTSPSGFATLPMECAIIGVLIPVMNLSDLILVERIGPDWRKRKLYAVAGDDRDCRSFRFSNSG